MRRPVPSAPPRYHLIGGAAVTGHIPSSDPQSVRRPLLSADDAAKLSAATGCDYGAAAGGRRVWVDLAARPTRDSAPADRPARLRAVSELSPDCHCPLRPAAARTSRLPSHRQLVRCPERERGVRSSLGRRFSHAVV